MISMTFSFMSYISNDRFHLYFNVLFFLSKARLGKLDFMFQLFHFPFISCLENVKSIYILWKTVFFLIAHIFYFLQFLKSTCVT